MRHLAVLAAALLALPALPACSDDVDGGPDLGTDSRPPDGKPADRGVDLADQGSDAAPCTPNEQRCTGNVRERCTANGTAFATAEDCSATAPPGVTYTCETCPGSTPASATCKAQKTLFSGKLTSSIANLDYVYVRECAPLAVAAAFASGGFSHSVYPAGTQDGGYPTLTLAAKDPTKAPSGQFLLFTAGAGQNPPVSVVLKPSPNVECKNTSPTGAGTPPGAGMATLTYAETKPGETISIMLDGWVTCDEGVSWKAFKYNATGLAF